MTTDDLIAQFEACRLPGSAFHHAQHVEAAWGYLHRYPVPEAVARFTAALQRFAAAQGAPGKYDAAMTTAYLGKIAERLARDPAADWPAFAARHADLMSHG